MSLWKQNGIPEKCSCAAICKAFMWIFSHISYMPVFYKLCKQPQRHSGKTLAFHQSSNPKTTLRRIACSCLPLVGSLQYPDHMYWCPPPSIYLFGVLRRFQHCTGHITTGSWKGRGNQHIQLVKVLYCKLPTKGKQLPALPLEAVPGTEPRPQRWEARLYPLLRPSIYLFIWGFASLSTLYRSYHAG